MERLDAFMARAGGAYYARRDPFADFTTAPEISQVFGEILGLWAAVTWQGLGAPDPVLLLEAGPGRGTLMADALRAIGPAVPAFRSALRLHLIESSPRLRTVQAMVLPNAVWHDGLDTVPEAPLIVLGNEFLDALPIRQFVRRGDMWAERFVADGRFVEVATAFRPMGGREAVAVPDGTILERNESAEAFVSALARRFIAHQGAALLLDYGPAASDFGDSLQALRAGRPANPLGPPGEADLTAHVDFATLAAAAAAIGASVHGPLAQGVFLTRLGLFQRSGALARSQPPARAAAIIDAASRLAEPSRMGRLFKAFALSSPRAQALAGFA
jgi:NADH dehydrogenase [ubiquinone] 1 alpha subcomplex assembly factor 7